MIREPGREGQPGHLARSPALLTRQPKLGANEGQAHAVQSLASRFRLCILCTFTIYS